ncbi:VOC family protein [Phenylobacterium sp.]|uniref:VOC family protein n=1 Tax=Phenylobacterium sp. TaxID=1871053 RepID=UPI003522B207
MASETMTPPTVTGVTPYINVQGASEASAFYQKAFGAKELMRMPAEDGKRLMHCHLEINGGPLLMSDCWPEEGHPHQPSNSFTMHLQVDDIDAWWKRAINAGATPVMPVADMF